MESVRRLTGMQRVEIITGRERRRRWSAEEKARLVAEAFAPGAILSHVARSHEVAESCLYAWRKQLSGRKDRRWAGGARHTAADPGFPCLLRAGGGRRGAGHGGLGRGHLARRNAAGSRRRLSGPYPAGSGSRPAEPAMIAIPQ